MVHLPDFIVELIADFLVVPIVFVGAWAMLRLPKTARYQRIARGVMTGLTALLLAKIASLLYQGERPFVELGVEPKAAYLSNPGFPSDHVLFVFTITFVVWASTKNKRLGLIFLTASCLVALGRVVALVHTPADVVGGIACALIAAFMWYGPTFLKRDLPSSKSF